MESLRASAAVDGMVVVLPRSDDEGYLADGTGGEKKLYLLIYLFSIYLSRY